MIKKLTSKIDSISKKRFLSNFFALASLQAANYILPLITLPYLVRVIGVDHFGLLAFSAATIAYFGILTDYGFNLTATRKISIDREDKEKVTEIFSSVMTIKTFLLITSFVLLAIFVFSFEKFSTYRGIYFLTFGTVIGQALFPIWFFQGMEKMKYITYINILSKLFFTMSIFVFVRQEDDYYLVPALTSFGSIIGGLFALYLIKKEFDISFKLQPIKNLKFYLIDGWHIFLTSMQSSILSSSGVFILGIFQSHEIVGYYSAVEKIMKAFVGLFAPVTQALYPITSSKLHKSHASGQSFVIKMASITLFFAVLLILFIGFFSKDIVSLILGDKFIQYDYILKTLSIWLFFGVLNNFIGIQYLTALGLKQYYMKSFFVASSLALTIYFSLTPLMGVYGILIGMLTSEIVLTMGMTFYIIKNHIWKPTNDLLDEQMQLTKGI